MDITMIGSGELILILIVALVLFGGKRLPEFARSLGLAMQEFRRAMHEPLETTPSKNSSCNPPTVEHKEESQGESKRL